jgi:membrane-associated protein
MFDIIYQFSPYAPVVIFISSFLDIFFVSGLILYGAAMMGSVVLMYTTGMISAELIIISAFSGTLLGNLLNYATGRMLSDVPIVKNRLQNPKLKKAHRFLKSRGLFLYIGTCRFVAVTRPLYALLAGSLKVSFQRFLIYEIIVALVWVIFWLIILIQGEAIYSRIFG